jgi:hypothetical protein
MPAAAVLIFCIAASDKRLPSLSTWLTKLFRWFIKYVCKLPNRQYSTITNSSPVTAEHQFITILLELYKGTVLPLMRVLVQAPSKLTTFKCAPKWIRIFNSLTKASRAAALVWERTILTATVWTFSSESLTPTASALTTRPKHPAPSCTPAFLNG